jgi:hypothetical protein
MPVEVIPNGGTTPVTVPTWAEFRAGSVRLDNFRGSIGVVLPGLRCVLPHRGWDGGRA